MNAIPRALARVGRMLLSPDARPLRIAVTLGFAAVLQLGLFVVLLAAGVRPLSADSIAFLLGAQAGFVLSDRFVWNDRRYGGSSKL